MLLLVQCIGLLLFVSCVGAAWWPPRSVLPGDQLRARAGWVCFWVIPIYQLFGLTCLRAGLPKWSPFFVCCLMSACLCVGLAVWLPSSFCLLLFVWLTYYPPGPDWLCTDSSLFACASVQAKLSVVLSRLLLSVVARPLLSVSPPVSLVSLRIIGPSSQ